MKNIRVLVLLVPTITILIIGCATPSELLEPSFVQQIHLGQNRPEVRNLLGSPNWSRSGSAGQTAETFIYTEIVFSSSSASASARDLKVRSFSIRFDNDGRVQQTLFNESRTPSVLLRHSAYFGPTITADDVAAIRAGTTTRQELENTFGKPLVVSLNPVRGVELHWYEIELGVSVRHFEDQQGLHVLVDDLGIVRSVGFSDTTDRVK